MSTKISAIIDDLGTRLAALYPNHNELVNPYFPEDESNLTIKKGYGFTILEGSNAKAEITRIVPNRTFDLILTRSTLSADLKLAEAIAKRRQAEKDLFEDQFLFLQFIRTDTYLKSSDFDNLAKIQYVSDDGINFVRTGNHSILIMRTVLEVEYFETI